MNRKGFVNIGFIVFGIIVLGAIGYFIFEPRTQAPEGCVKVVGGDPMGVSNDCNTISECDFYKTPENKSMLDFCYFGVATNKNGDTNACNLVSNESMRNRCLENIAKQSVSAGTRKINLFYYNKIKDVDFSCSRDAILPVEREIPVSVTPIQDSVNLLLKGNLSDTEKLAGFQTEFPLSGFSLIGVNLKDGMLTLQFDDQGNRSGGGSCRVMLLWSQIAKTALQFPEVKQVRFEPEELFQP